MASNFCDCSSREIQASSGNDANRVVVTTEGPAPVSANVVLIVRAESTRYRPSPFFRHNTRSRTYRQCRGSWSWAHPKMAGLGRVGEVLACVYEFLVQSVNFGGEYRGRSYNGESVVRYADGEGGDRGLCRGPPFTRIRGFRGDGGLSFTRASRATTGRWSECAPPVKVVGGEPICCHLHAEAWAWRSDGARWRSAATRQLALDTACSTSRNMSPERCGNPFEESSKTWMDLRLTTWYVVPTSCPRQSASSLPAPAATISGQAHPLNRPQCSPAAGRTPPQPIHGVRRQSAASHRIREGESESVACTVKRAGALPPYAERGILRRGSRGDPSRHSPSAASPSASCRTAGATKGAVGCPVRTHGTVDCPGICGTTAAREAEARRRDTAAPAGSSEKAGAGPSPTVIWPGLAIGEVAGLRGGSEPKIDFSCWGDAMLMATSGSCTVKIAGPRPAPVPACTGPGFCTGTGTGAASAPTGAAGVGATNSSARRCDRRIG
eukprot:scaffold5448_cov113-Isochrysis_galbana.AAC.4